MSDAKNLLVTEVNGRWSASWDRNGMHFDVDYLYGAGHPRSFTTLKGILEEDHGIQLPSELAVKSHAIQRGHKNVYEVREELLHYRKEARPQLKGIHPKYKNMGER